MQKTIVVFLSVATLTASAATWTGANGICALDDASKWSGFTSWDDTSTWLINRGNATAAKCEATISADFTLPNLTLRGTGVLLDFNLGGHVFTVSSSAFTLHNSFTPHTMKFRDGTFSFVGGTTTNTITIGKNVGDANLIFDNAVFNGNLIFQEHANSSVTVSGGAKWYGSLTDSNASGDRIIITGAGTTVDGMGRAFRVAGAALKSYVTNASYLRYFKNMYCELADGAILKNVASIYVGEYGNLATMCVSNATVDAASAALNVGWESYATNNVFRLVSGSTASVGAVYVGQAGDDCVLEVSDSSSLTVNGSYFIVANKTNADRNEVRVLAGSVLTNKAETVYIGTANTHGSALRVKGSGSRYSGTSQLTIGYQNAGDGTVEVADGAVFEAQSIKCGWQDTRSTVPARVIVSSGATMSLTGTLTLTGTGNELSISNGTVNVLGLAEANGNTNTIFFAGEQPSLNIANSSNTQIRQNTVLDFTIPQSGYVTTPIVCTAGTLEIKSGTDIEIVNAGYAGKLTLAKADAGITLESGLLAAWNAKFAAQKYKLALEDGNTKLTLKLPGMGLMILFR